MNGRPVVFDIPVFVSSSKAWRIGGSNIPASFIVFVGVTDQGEACGWDVEALGDFEEDGVKRNKGTHMPAVRVPISASAVERAMPT